MIEAALIDVSGVLTMGNQLIVGGLAAVQRLRALDIPFLFVTNSTRKTPQEIIQQLYDLGVVINESELFTATTAAREYCCANKLRPYLLIRRSILPFFTDLCLDPRNAVLLGDAAEDFTYSHMNEAFQLLQQGAQLIAMGKNRYFQTPGGLQLDAGAFVVALEYASGKQAMIIGKPATEFFHSAVASLGCNPHNVVMIGDDVEADVNGATAAGLQGLLVQTGKYRAGDEKRLADHRSTMVADFSEAVQWIAQHSRTLCYSS